MSDEKATALRSIRFERLPQGSELVLRILKTGTGRYRLRVSIERFRGTDAGESHIDTLVSGAIRKLRARGQGSLIEAAIHEISHIKSEVKAAADAAVQMVDKVMPFADLALDVAVFAADNLAAAAVKMLDAGAGKRM